MNDKVSIIVPVYKVEQYIHKCIGSIINQTYSNIEIILIDDESPDHCGIICDDYAKKDSRIQVVHKKNGGLSEARNDGLLLSTGDYVTFLDSDDYMYPNHIENMMNSICDADIYIGGYTVQYGGKLYLVKNDLVDSAFVGESKQRLFEHLLLEKPNNREFPFHLMPVWKNLYKRSLIEQNNIRFLSEREIYAEDYIFNVYAYCYAKKIVLSGLGTMVHLISRDSLSQGYRKNYYEMQKSKYLATMQFIQNHSGPLVIDEYSKLLPYVLAYSLFKENRTSKKEAMARTSKILEDSFARKIMETYSVCEHGIKERIIYALARRGKTRTIFVTVRAMCYLEPLYRAINLRL